MKENAVKFDYIKIQNACMAKKHNQAKRQMIMCMEIGFAGEDSNLHYRELILNVFNEF